ncbi:HAD-IC family P-type ATPase [Candidatus Falkowbacteria bacterium]|nr:HAD-IC family P-type ATPase [Candidatus Falkowbacteria bacterium]
MFNFHSCSIKSCLAELKTKKNGLSKEQAKARLRKYGANKLEDKKPLSSLVIFISQFKSPLIYILLGAGLISLLLQEYVDAGVIFIAVALNTVIGFIQENKANNALSKLKEMVEHKALVMRDGNEVEIDSSQVVPGDIIVIEAGNRIPADARLIEVADLKVNEANLTGESIPSTKSLKPIDKGAPLADRENMVYASTVAVSGKGLAVVAACGKDTEIGKISELVKATKEEETPLQSRLASFSRLLGIIVILVSILVMVIGLLQGREFFEMFLISVAVAVAAIPEGLVVSVTFILVLGMQMILKEKALTRKLVAAETLGSTTVICTDKTGTLTEGKMTVSQIVIGEKEFEVGSEGSRQAKGEAKAVSLALQTGMMCNNAVIENPDDNLKEFRIIGMPTEAALMSSALQSGLDRKRLMKEEPKIDEQPFSSDTKFMSTLHKKGRSSLVLYEKGAPEILISKSKYYYHKGKESALNEAAKTKLHRNYEKLTKKGLRVIGVAIRDLKNVSWDPENKKKDWKKIDKDLTFIGFIALKDPLRSDVKKTIKKTSRAGIRSVIITGDHKLTAMAIAEEAGLKAKLENIMTGEDMDKIDDEELKKVVGRISIYARVSPHHKLRIIQALQAKNEVVAMTGDGINDSPALKAADIGIALGTGTDIAKETSDIVLLDNSFKVIVSAVRQGRIIFSNIKKVITYLVSDAYSEIILVVGSIVFGTPLAILPAQILWINIINDGLPHFSLAFEKGAPGTMKRKPISKSADIVDTEMKIIIFGVGLVRDLIILAIFIWMYRNGYDIALLRSIFFAVLGFKSLATIYSLRSLSQPIWRINPFRNWYLVGATFISLCLLLLAIYLPFFQDILSTQSLSFNNWYLIGGIALFSIILTEVAKAHFVIKEQKVS